MTVIPRGEILGDGAGRGATRVRATGASPSDEPSDSRRVRCGCQQNEISQGGGS